MLLKICLLGLGLAMLATYHPAAAEAVAAAAEPQPLTATPEETLASVPFETSHKHPEAAAHSEEGFHTAHRISVRATDAADYSMNLLPTKERPELNPVLSALINEDVMKSIEAKRAIEEEELAEVRREIEEAALAELAQRATEAPVPQLTTLPAATKKIDNLDEDVVVDPHDEFVNQNFALESAGSENSKKSRIEIKKGPNGQDYEYEYVYYYEDDADDAAAAPAKAAVADAAGDAETRGKTRYTNIERSTPASPSENSLQSGKAKGRSSSSVSDGAEDIELERLPVNTRFPSRGKNIEVPPTPALDSLETAAERKKISVKRPSLELVDSETFNTDEKQQKGSRNGDNELKPVIAVEQEQAAAAAAKERELQKQEEQKKKQQQEEQQQQAQDDLTGITDEAEQTTPSMEKAALDLYAILTNENLNNEQTTSADGALEDATTLSPDTASTDEDDASLTTLQEELSSSSSSTTTSTTTTTTEAPTTTSTTTTTTTAAPSLFGGRRSGLNGLAGRNRFKLREGGAAAAGAGASSTTSTTEAPATEATKTGRNRFSRPSIGGRSRPGARTTATPESSPAPAPGAEEEVVVAKEVKPVSSGFARGRPRNRFNLRGSTTSTTTERSAEEAADASASPDAVASTTARSALRGRPGIGLRGRSRTTTTKAPAAEGSSADEATSSEEGKAAAAPAPAAAPAEGVRPSRFNLHRAGGNRLLPRGKLGRAGVSTEAPKAEAAAEDSAADSTSHHNDVKGAVEAAEGAEKTEGGDAAGAPAGPVSGFNRLKNRPRLNALHKTDAAKPKAAAGAATSPAALAPRKINPLLAKRRLQLGGAAAAAATSTTELPADEEHASPDGDSSGEHAAKEEANAGSEESGSDSAAKEQDTTEAAETTTKQQARGLGLLGQRRRLPLRKPGTIL
ncbi:mucin-19 [Drosophila obscura]|uniref:mucin-19 n=1 Tax=Drosophila obscura TaxID=7282 RepID=UPI001BB16F10|nr:mucin-19 [Drosophila obscura]